MARPRKKGLDYFPLDVDFFSDKKIRILKSRFGVDGIAIYLYLLCEIYKNGYYIHLDEDFEYIMSDDLNMSSDKVKQVLKFLLERSLFDNKLFQSDTILTSAGIQRRFQLAVKERAKKNPIKISRFWLLKKDETEPFIKVTQNEDLSGNIENYSGKNVHKSKEKSLKESKVNKSIYYENPALEESFLLYLDMRNHTGPQLSKEQIYALKQELDQLATSDEEKIGIVRKAFASGWKSFYPIRRKKNPQEKTTKQNQHNFKQREYTDQEWTDLEQKLLKRQLEEG